MSDENAKALVNVSLSLVVQFLNAPKGKNDQLKRYAQAMAPLMQPLVEEWERRYGALYPRPQPASGNGEE